MLTHGVWQPRWLRGCCQCARCRWWLEAPRHSQPNDLAAAAQQEAKSAGAQSARLPQAASGRGTASGPGQPYTMQLCAPHSTSAQGLMETTVACPRGASSCSGCELADGGLYAHCIDLRVRGGASVLLGPKLAATCESRLNPTGQISLPACTYVAASAKNVIFLHFALDCVHLATCHRSRSSSTRRALTIFCLSRRKLVARPASSHQSRFLRTIFRCALNFAPLPMGSSLS